MILSAQETFRVQMCQHSEPNTPSLYLLPVCISVCRRALSRLQVSAAHMHPSSCEAHSCVDHLHFYQNVFFQSSHFSKKCDGRHRRRLLNNTNKTCMRGVAMTMFYCLQRRELNSLFCVYFSYNYSSAVLFSISRSSCCLCLHMWLISSLPSSCLNTEDSDSPSPVVHHESRRVTVCE